MPYVRRTASGRINAVYDRPSREAKERVRTNDPELLKFLGLAPTQSASPAAPAVMVAPGRSEPAPSAPPPPPEPDWAEEEDADASVYEDDWASDSLDEMHEEEPAPRDDGRDDSEDDFAGDQGGEAPTIDMDDDDYGTDPPQTTHAPPSASGQNRPSPRSAPREAPHPEDASPEDASNEEGDGPEDDVALRQLDESDLEMARITEDLIDLMIAKNLINFTDFPTMAQRKLINRRALRSNMSALSNLVSDEESIF